MISIIIHVDGAADRCGAPLRDSARTRKTRTSVREIFNGQFHGSTAALSVLRTKFPDATTLPHELTELEMQRDERTGPLVEAKRVEGLARRIFLVPWTRISRLHFMY